MKKTLITLTLAVSLFVAACGGSAPEYDFSGGEKFMASVQKQAAAEGISEADAKTLVGAYTAILLQDKVAELEAIADADREAYVMAIFEENMKGKTLVEIVEFMENETAE